MVIVKRSNVGESGGATMQVVPSTGGVAWDVFDSLPAAVRERMRAAVGQYDPANVKDMLDRHGEDKVLLMLDNHDRTLYRGLYGVPFACRGVVRT